MLTPFEFIASVSHDATAGNFFLDVPAGIQSKRDLFSILARVGKFPGYFGNNWDALLDCLRDFQWIQEKKIIIMHSDVPLHSNPVDCRTYLEILREAVNDWAPTAGRTECSTGSVAFSEHELRVLFPATDRLTVVEMLIKKTTFPTSN